MIGSLFNVWERRLASVDTDRVVRPFDWGLEWIGLEGAPDPLAALTTWSDQAVENSARFYATPETDDYELHASTLRFPSAIASPFDINNTVIAQLFRPETTGRADRRRAVVVLPQWNADAHGHAGLCRLFARFGLTALRVTLPYHGERRPPDLRRADYIVSSNVGRTLHANRQAVVDAKRAVHWLARQGFDDIGIVGTSLGSCLAMLTMAHDERIKVGAFNHISPYFADVVWRGLSTRHVRAGLDGHIDLEALRTCWMPISPWPFVSRVRDRASLLVYARYDTTFPVDLSRKFVAEFDRIGAGFTTTILPCGHYTTGKTPFKFLDGYALTKFFLTRL